MSINEAFAKNMTGKRIKFAEQPYASGEGTITHIECRKIENVKTFDPRLGTVYQTYECFDLTIACDSGSHVGALIAGVPVRDTVKGMDGQSYTLVGCTFGEIYDAVEHGKGIVKARCG